MTSAEEAGRLLRELLTNESRYRARWQRYAQRLRTDEPSLAGVAQVLALYLCESGERSETERDLPRKLRDRVRRALSGEILTAGTLALFISAFDMDERRQHDLWKALAGREETQSSLVALGIVDTIDETPPMAKPQRHRTLSLFERYFVGQDRRVISRHTTHVIMALEDHVDSYVYEHARDVAKIEIVTGGRLGRHFEYGDGFAADDIVFDAPLRHNMTAAIEHWTHYYRTGPVPGEVRRLFRGRCENIDIAVQFELGGVPDAVWFATWRSQFNGEALNREEKLLNGHGLTHHFVPFAMRSVIGFCWEW